MRFKTFIVAFVFALACVPIASSYPTEEELANTLAPPLSQCNNVTLSNSAELYVGNDSCQTIFALGGADIIRGDDADGNNAGDRIYGGEGNDTLSGEDGNDLVVAGCKNGGCNAGSNGLSGNDGNDVLGGDNGNPDNFDCGSGSNDTAYTDSDAIEGFIRNCEHRIVNGVKVR